MPRGPDPDVSAVEILRYMIENPDPGFTANEIGEHFGKTRQWADHRLGKMEDDGLVKVKKGGARSKWYWPSEKGKRQFWDRRED